MKEYFLHPGEIYFSGEPCLITTILGSCIAVCIYDTKKKIGGMCHYYLPYANGSQKGENNYGEFAIINLLKKLKKSGSSPENVIAKVVGGGHVIEDMEESEKEVGKENIKLALMLLKKFGIEVTGKSLGGYEGKKIRFNNRSGEVKIKNIESRRNISKAAQKIKVMIVDDSAIIRKIIKKMIEADTGLKVIHEAESAFVAEQLIKLEKPDVITLDINMPGLDGVTFLSRYMRTDPIPTIMVTALNYNDSGPVFQALENGAFDYIKKPDLQEIDSLTFDLQEKIKAAFKSKGKVSALRKNKLVVKEKMESPNYVLNKYLIVLGASTGGTEAIKEVLVRLPNNIPPILIVQHIPALFSLAFANRMNELCDFEVKEGMDGDEIKMNRVIIAPGGKQMKFVYGNSGMNIKITDDPPVNRFKPSVDYLFNSVLNFKEKRIISILLTGMGVDGAEGLLNLKRSGAFTIAQDEATSAVYGMPKAAFERGAASKICGLYEIPRMIMKNLI